MTSLDTARESTEDAVPRPEGTEEGRDGRHRYVMERPTHASLAAAGPWRALRYCPGRSVWQGPTGLTPADLAGADTPVRVFHVDKAPDPVHVVALADGGLISYARPDGTFVHTLNTPEGFARKLEDLGIGLNT